MNNPSLFRYQAIGHKGPVSALIAFRQGRAPAVIYYDPDLRTPARNPAPTDSVGRVNLYMNAGQSYEVTVQFPDGTTDQFMHTAVPMGSVEIIREPAPEPVTVDRVVHQDSPETLAELERLRGIEREHARAALMAGLAKLEDAKAKVDIPAELKEYLRVGETYEQTNTRLLPIYKEAQNMKEMAIENSDKTARVFWELKIRKLDLAMHWMHGRLIETV
jgi:hypothetical protein